MVLSRLETFTGKLDEKESASGIFVNIWCHVGGCGQRSPPPPYFAMEGQKLLLQGSLDAGGFKKRKCLSHD